MSVRRCAGALTALALTIALAATTTSAEADPPFVPKSSDLIGVGAAETQAVLGQLAAQWNATHSSGRIASFDATGSAQIQLDEAHLPVNRPTDSASGKAMLYGAGNNSDVDFVRSVTANSAAEGDADLRMFPFARDGLGVVVSATATHAPASLTGAQLLDIYTGDVTDWGQVGGQAGSIKPLAPPAGSLTRRAFDAQLKALNGGAAPTLAPTVTETPEHSDAAIKSEPDAVAPYSLGRAESSSTLDLTGGWRATWPVYNVVRSSAVTQSIVKAVLGTDGLICSGEARALLEAAGLRQLARPAEGGVCGVATGDPTTNLTLNPLSLTTTTLTASSPAASTARLTAKVMAGDVPAVGWVEFLDGNTPQAAVQLVGGVAAKTLTGEFPGQHTFRARYTPDDGSGFEGSTSPGVALMVRRSATTSIYAYPSSPSYGKSVQIRVSVSSYPVPSGQVTMRFRGTTRGLRLAGGKAAFTISGRTPAGRYPVTVRYGGSPTHAPSADSLTLIIKKAKVTATETFPFQALKGQRVKGAVRLRVEDSSVVPTGKILIKRGSKLLATGWLRSGTARLRLPPLAKSLNTLTIVYPGNANFARYQRSLYIFRK
ncbi:Ig-like domain repeat protein [Nocardioides speluncae]|uniref:Ig-like domain repeat protein n=1 Tax=Nocardioides speluncae TaxID=2670337 RepID=UPI000D6894B6|nr:Ig-like domain repeat protein [Nocardioides speluncae]